MLSLATSLEARPRLGLILLGETSYCYLALKAKKKSQAEKKGGINKAGNENRGKEGKGFRGCSVCQDGNCLRRGRRWIEGARQLTVGREAKGKAECSFPEVCLYVWLLSVFAFC